MDRTLSSASKALSKENFDTVLAYTKEKEKELKDVMYQGEVAALPYVLDETGTVANTAFMAGDDWSFCVQTMGGFYYKYAFSALYYPIYIAFRSNPVYMYKAMISSNMLIMSFFSYRN